MKNPLFSLVILMALFTSGLFLVQSFAEEECEGNECECPPGECEPIQDPIIIQGPPAPPTPQGTGSPETHPTIGVCYKNPANQAWQCLASYPHPFVDGFREYDECRRTFPYNIKDCLQTWAQSKNLTSCGPVKPGTNNPQVPGSGEIEIPMSGGKSNLHQYALNYQCTGQNNAPDRWSETAHALGKRWKRRARRRSTR